MKRDLPRMLFLVAFSLLATAAPGYCHDPKYHKEHPFVGSVSSLNDKGFTLKTDKGDVPVVTNEETKFEAGTNGEKAAKSDLHESQKVTIIGTRVESGDLVAKEIMIDKGQASEGRTQTR